MNRTPGSEPGGLVVLRHTFFTRFWVMLMLPVWETHVENHSYGRSLGRPEFLCVSCFSSTRMHEEKLDIKPPTSEFLKNAAALLPFVFLFCFV
jgi:hypothetical protein